MTEERSQYDIDKTIIEIVRYRGLTYTEGISILSQTFTESQRFELCSVLEQWEDRYARCKECGDSFIDPSVKPSHATPSLCTECALIESIDREMVAGAVA